jgi:hypothetical protein
MRHLSVTTTPQIVILPSQVETVTSAQAAHFCDTHLTLHVTLLAVAVTLRVTPAAGH